MHGIERLDVHPHRPHLRLTDKLHPLWVMICITSGVVFGRLVPAIPTALDRWPPVYETLAAFCVLMFTLQLLASSPVSLPRLLKKPRPIFFIAAGEFLFRPILIFLVAAFILRVVLRSMVAPGLATEYLMGIALVCAIPSGIKILEGSRLAEGEPAWTRTLAGLSDIIAPFLVPLVGFTFPEILGLPVENLTVLTAVALVGFLPVLLAALIRNLSSMVHRSDSKHDSQHRHFASFGSAATLAVLPIVFLWQSGPFFANPGHLFLVGLAAFFAAGMTFAGSLLVSWRCHQSYELSAPTGIAAGTGNTALGLALALLFYGPSTGSVLGVAAWALVEIPTLSILSKTAWLLRKKLPRNATVSETFH